MDSGLRAHLPPPCSHTSYPCMEPSRSSESWGLELVSQGSVPGVTGFLPLVEVPPCVLQLQ